MKKKIPMKALGWAILLGMLVTACSGTAAQDTQDTQSGSSNTGQAEAAVTATVEVPTETAAPTQMFTATPDTRIPPEEWQTWPIIPEVTNKSREIYQAGLNKGINAQTFSKIGDCQNIKESFMGIYDLGRYYLGSEQSEWQETIDNFSGYFNRDGKAIEQGLNVAAALSPLQADPEECQGGESPLACELRVANPSFAFVSFERWWPDVTPPDQYEKYLRLVLETIMDNGTVPILVTKADNIEGGHQLNLIIAKLAYEYDLPLYNWWKAAQPLPHRGMDPERNDGFHISTDAWTERSAYALGTLDNLWKGLRGY
jgi:hypothetical protein